MVNYTLTITNLNDSSSEPIVVTGIQEQYFIFNGSSSASCDTYSFQVTALNAAGAGNPSEVITWSPSLLPDISQVEESLNHSLMVTSQGIQLTTRFQVSLYHYLPVGKKMPTMHTYISSFTIEPLIYGHLIIIILWGGGGGVDILIKTTAGQWGLNNLLQ